MKIVDDALIKELVYNYQKTGNNFNKILLELSEYIYNYPRIHSQKEDVSGEFYVYFCNRLPQALMHYKEQDCKFLTWLTVVLYRHYLNWVKSTNKLVNKETMYLDVSYIAKEYMSPDSVDRDGLEDRAVIDTEAMEGILNSLPSKVKIVIKLYYFDFFKSKDAKEAGLIFKQDEYVLFTKYKGLLEGVRGEYEKRNNLWDALNSSYNDLILCKNKLLKLEEDKYASADEKNKLKRKIEKSEIKHKKCLSIYQSFFITIKHELISDFLGISVNAVNNLVYRGKRIIKEKLKQFL